MAENKVVGKANSVLQFMAGGFLESQALRKYIPTIVVLVVIILLYTANGYNMYSIEMKNKRLDKEVKELRAEFVATKQQQIKMTKYGSIQEIIKEKQLDLEEPKTPAFTISTDGRK
ncbi:MAG: hypothetical protein J5588_03735 [Bacteroidales bacterium]|jgi:hypothetical protein|nr:hypothetical protein [Bacteroidales bacterium]MBO7124378.1 hypothetical protein [Bacteroidales bacterium]